MMMIFGIPAPLMFGQLLLGLINGAFYAMLSLGLAVIFGMLNIINFAHGALFMMGAFAAWMLLHYAGIGYFPSLILAPLLVGIFGIVLEKTMISRLYKLDHLYGLLLTFGLALVIQGLFRNYYGSSGLPYRIPDVLQGATDLGFMFMPNYRGWVVLAALVVCLATWAMIEKTSLGATLRAATENAPLVQAFGVNVPRLITLTYGGGVALAAFAGVLAAPIYSVNPNMGDNFINTVFAVVVIGGMGSILGSIVTGFGARRDRGADQGVLSGGVGDGGVPGDGDRAVDPAARICSESEPDMFGFSRPQWIGFLFMLALIVVCPYVLYPVFLMRVLCMALFACAFNLMIGYVGLLSFGHAAFFGMGSYVSAWTMKFWHVDAVFAIALGGIAGAVLGLCLGYLAIRRSGIYFAMITLALAQMVYFFCLEAPFTGGEDGIQQVPRGHTVRRDLDLNNDMTMYWVVAAVFVGELPADPSHHPLAVRPGAEGDPRERAARHVVGLPDRRLQADRLHPVVHAVRRGGGHQGARVRHRHADRRALFDLGRGGADHAAGRAGHGVRAGDGRGGGDRDGELPGAVRLLGDGDAGGDLRGLRAGVPARHHRRVRRLAAAGAVGGVALPAGRRSR